MTFPFALWLSQINKSRRMTSSMCYLIWTLALTLWRNRKSHFFPEPYSEKVSLLIIKLKGVLLRLWEDFDLSLESTTSLADASITWHLELITYFPVLPWLTGQLGCGINRLFLVRVGKLTAKRSFPTADTIKSQHQSQTVMRVASWKIEAYN